MPIILRILPASIPKDVERTVQSIATRLDASGWTELHGNLERTFRHLTLTVEDVEQRLVATGIDTRYVDVETASSEWSTGKEDSPAL
jgi:hypothetical protein